MPPRVYAIIAFAVQVLIVAFVVDLGLRVAVRAIAGTQAVWAVYHFEHGAFLTVPVGSLDDCHQLQTAARDPARMVTVTAPHSIDAAGIVKGNTYHIVGISCPDDAEEV